MAKVSHLDTAADLIARASALIAQGIGLADKRERAAFSALLDGADALARWRKDTTEASRRVALAHAARALALVDADLFAQTAFSRAVQRLALACELTTSGNAIAAINLAASFRAVQARPAETEAVWVHA